MTLIQSRPNQQDLQFSIFDFRLARKTGLQTPSFMLEHQPQTSALTLHRNCSASFFLQLKIRSAATNRSIDIPQIQLLSFFEGVVISQKSWRLRRYVAQALSQQSLSCSLASSKAAGSRGAIVWDRSHEMLRPTIEDTKLAADLEDVFLLYMSSVGEIVQEKMAKISKGDWVSFEIVEDSLDDQIPGDAPRVIQDSRRLFVAGSVVQNAYIIPDWT